MSTDRNGDERLAGKAHRPEAASRPGSAADGESAPGLESTAECIGEALRQQPVSDTAEQAALAAFRSARSANAEALRTRRRDDWRPRPQKQRWARGGAVAFVTSALLGGIAFASIGVVNTRQHDIAGPEASRSTPRPSASPGLTPRERSAPPSPPRAQHGTH
ncbi:hypothetical protein ACWKT3_00340 [Streptomyces violaceus]